MAFDKTILIEHRIEKSKETVKAVKILIDNNLLSHAENRIYYAIFYIVSALAFKYDFSTSKHKQLLGWFNKNFIFNNKVSVELKNTYKDAFENRQEGDYNDYKVFNIEQVEIHFEKMKHFILEVEKIIREDNIITDKTK